MSVKSNIHKAYRRLIRIPHDIQIYKNRQDIILDNLQRKAIPNRVNLDWYSDCRTDGKENIGDYLAVPIFEYITDYFGLDRKMYTEQTRHLYTVGSIIFFGYQKATIWGSGLICKPKLAIYRELDFRAVRGPLTRKVISEMRGGYKVPDVYGDPAVLMPLVYTPNQARENKEYGIILHKHVLHDSMEHYIDVMTNNYKATIDEIVSCNKIISSSLHGIILAETYGIPAVLLNDGRNGFDMFKYNDYYYSTGRFTFPVATSVEEAIRMTPPDVPDFRQMRDKLIETFPRDLWN